MGTCAVFTLRAPRRRSVRCGGNFAYFFGRFEPAQVARDRVPVVALHAAIFGLRDGHGSDRTIGPAILADKSVRIGQDFVAGGGVERSAFGILDARIEVERGLLGAARVVDALFARKRVDVGGVEIEIAGERARVATASGIPLNGSSEVIFASSSAEFSMRSRRFAGEVAGIGAGGALPWKTRTPMDLEPASFNVSTWPRRTSVENSSPSRTTHSAAVAPPAMARRTMSWARS